MLTQQYDVGKKGNHVDMKKKLCDSVRLLEADEQAHDSFLDTINGQVKVR